MRRERREPRGRKVKMVLRGLGLWERMEIRSGGGMVVCCVYAGIFRECEMRGDGGEL